MPALLDTPVPHRRLLRSRLGRRLLLQFAGCALIPTCAVAYLSFRSVSNQLTRQSEQRLTSLTEAAAKTIYDRLTFFETDVRRQASQLAACAASPRPSVSGGCGEALLYAAEGVVGIQRGAARHLAGQSAALQTFPDSLLTTLEPGQSSVLALHDGTKELRLYVAHRPEAASQITLVARVSASYLWSPADAEALPGNITLSLLDPESWLLAGPPVDFASLPLGPVGSGSAARSSSRFVSTYAVLPNAPGFSAPRWRIVLSEPRADVTAPVAGFARTFPLVLALVLLSVVAVSLNQIRRSLIPLRELGQGTRRIAAGDFHTPVRVNSADELEELGEAFNTMSAKLEHQFYALNTVAEIDRAILSSVDTATIAQSVLDRLPDVCPCRGISLTVQGPQPGAPGSTWMELERGTTRSRVAAELTPEDILLTRQQPEWFVLGDGALPLPPYLSHFAESEASVVVACPLHHGGELLGVLALRGDPGKHSNESLLYLRRLADRVAVALSNASMMDQVRVLAFYDTLTRLPNRVLYRERLGQAIGRAQHRKSKVGVCSIDLDHFSRINDTLGHGQGDQLVQEVASRLLALCQREMGAAPNDWEAMGIQLARVSGDEFTVILPDLAEPQEAVQLARRLLAAFQQPFRLGSQEVFVTASMGIAIYPEDGADPETLHQHADVAMSYAKDEGRNTVELFSVSMTADAVGRLRLERELRRAVDNGEFTMWYQPIVDLRTLYASGVEALVRWQHPERGLVLPEEFIGLCEETGLIVPLGEWSLRTVCAQHKAWELEGLDSPRMWVNLSARQLRQRGIVRTVQDILEETGVHPSSLAIELTESLLMEQGGTTERRIRELAELGLTLAIDDFGTGYSSLSYLKNFPVSILKIDRSFIVDISNSADAAAITTAMIALAQAMDLDVVAEGVETKAQAAFLRERGCQKVQGYLFGHPAPADHFTAYLRERKRGGVRHRPREGAAI